MFIYALKSAIVLSLLYLPYVLMLRRETFFRFNRAVLLSILLASLLLPLCNVSVLSLDENPVVSAAQQQMIEIGIPVARMLPEEEAEQKAQILAARKSLKTEAERVVKAMPQWKPAKHQGKLVRMEYTLPILFRLN